MSRLRLLILSLLLLLMQNAEATHIVGGEIIYRHLGSNNYRITLYLYIDCKRGSSQAIAQDADAIISFFRGSDNQRLFCETVSRKMPPDRIAKLNYNCVRNTPDECVDRYEYTFTRNLPPVNGGYIVSFQRCCRNNSITNIVNPQSTGATYWTLIPDPRVVGYNSSPSFNAMPPNFLCTNALLRFLHNATDPDKDSLAYELFTPFHGADQNDPKPGCNQHDNPPFPNIMWESGFSAQNPISGSPQLTIDPETGMLDMIPTATGQYVVGIKVKEYRNGVMIGYTQRDFQFNVVNCIVDVVSSFYAPSVICGLTYKFTNKSTGADRYLWDFGVAGITDDTSNLSVPTFTFPKAGVYRVKLSAFKGNCVDSFSMLLTVQAPLLPKLRNDTTICGATNSIVLDANIAGKSYYWSTGQSGQRIVASSQGLYWVELIDGKCKWRDSMRLFKDVSKLNAIGDTTICGLYPFVARPRIASGSYTNIRWNTGPADTGYSVSVSKPGTYIVSATNANKCRTSDTVNVKQYQDPKPVIRDTLLCPGLSILLDAQNPGATYRWSNGATSQTATYNQPGPHWVEINYIQCQIRNDFVISYRPAELDLGPDKKFCDVVNDVLWAEGSFDQYRWNNGSTQSTLAVSQAGKYTLDVTTKFGCRETDSITLRVFPSPTVNLGRDTLICMSVYLTLDAGPGFRYQWNTGSDKQTVSTVGSGLYAVMISDTNNCKGRDSVNIIKDPNALPSELYMPTGFTPNGDGLNELFPMHKFKDIGVEYNLKLFNRWGEKIWESDKPSENWDGRIKGNLSQQDVYVYLIRWIGCDNNRHVKSGTFTLVK